MDATPARQKFEVPAVYGGLGAGQSHSEIVRQQTADGVALACQHSYVGNTRSALPYMRQDWERIRDFRESHSSSSTYRSSGLYVIASNLEDKLPFLNLNQLPSLSFPSSPSA